MMVHKLEKMVSSAEEEEKETDDDGEEETEEEEEGSEKEGDDEEEEQETLPQGTDKKNPISVQGKKKKQTDVLNLNNEVVKMRKEVKRVRALIIRKLTRQIGTLKKKKGNETEMERNQRRAARLLEEIHAMKSLVPDQVTKTALQKNLSFEQVCKNPKSAISDRAIARIATHPQFNRKIENIKAAVKAFKDERIKSGKRGGKEKVQNEAGKATLQLQDERDERKGEEKEELKEDGEEGVLKDSEDGPVAKAGEEMKKGETSAVQTQKKTEPKSLRPALAKTSDVKHIVKNNPPIKKEKPNIQADPGDKESDLESSDDEEKEYFDDSTEERFHKQSSQSEESDDDDFFVGKVSKFKKKKKKPKDEEKETVVDKSPQVGKDSTDNAKSSDKLDSQLDELESRLKSKATKLESVFCSSLAATKAGGGGGVGRGRGGDKFRKHNKDFSKQSKFQKPEKGTERNSESKYSKPCLDSKHSESEDKGFVTAGRGRRQDRGNALRQKDHRGGGVSHRAPQQALHPSWEASKRRKEQQGQILAFQGKKIKFDDDD
ncbi:serum response factor-binding protein 1 [Archocentrus centrarchus]|uniref:serum response factor-binding protein 1 n=1 Tax=Archocentrus centrarchus TaxID=63155 RepID=UPI0011E9F88C|nr:serum response factor-binding protein 1 [Archocentrus centrarchus]